MVMMMKLVLQREPSTAECTLGSLTVDGDWYCWTLEDVVRHGPKLPGETAIPPGTYRVEVTHSPRFGTRLPLLHDVPGFAGVRIHPGNSASDTEGCILVGHRQAMNSILQSRAAFAPLLAKLEAAQARNEAITIEVRAAA